MGKRLGYLLVAVILGIEVPRFFGAYGGIDPDVLGLPLTALATGVVLPVGSMYIFHTWWTSKRKNRWALLIAFGVNLTLSGFILIPWGMARLTGEPLASVVVGWWAWAWVGAVMLSPFVLMAGITTAVAFQRETRTVTNPREAVKPVEEPEQAWTFADFERAATVGELDPTGLTGRQVAEMAGVSAATGRRWKRTWGDNGR